MVTTTDALEDAAQRKRVIAIAIATLLIFAMVVVDLAMGGRPDPPSLRAQATLLDGEWRFRVGDDPQWADTGADDSNWETIDLTAPKGSHDGDVGLPDYVAGWMAHGHSGYHGYAWYRRMVAVPAGGAEWDILGPTLVDHGYELYWNGQLLGGSGKIGRVPRVAGTRPLRFELPAHAAGTRGVLAVRAYMLPGSGANKEGGGMHSAPILAPRPVGEALHSAQWQRTIAGYIADAVEPIAMFALIGLAFAYRSRSGYAGFLIFASIALAFMAARRLNNAIVAWTDLQDLRTYSWLATWMWVPAVAAWSLAWNRWCSRPSRSIDLLTAVLTAASLAGVATHSAQLTHVTRLGWIALFVWIGARVMRNGNLRVLALVALVSVVLGLFGGELLDPIGVPGIWFPFGIGVSRTQYIYAVMIPLLAFLIVRSSRHRRVG
jgi:hypothetical protein